MKKLFWIFLVIISCSVSYGENFLLTTYVVDEPGSPLAIVMPQNIPSNYFVKVSFDTNLIFKFYHVLGQSVSIIPTPVLYGKSNLNIYVYKDNKEVFSTNVVLEYVGKKRKVFKLNLTETSKNILKDSKRIEEDRKYLLRTITSSTPVYFYPSELKPFILPSTNNITSPFGLLRKYSNGKINYHKGVDFSFTPDDNVYAANDGIVLVSSNFVANGKSVYIYHGLGIITSYFHLDEVYVKEGDYVKRGLVIGKIGETGIVTGRHLHFGVYIYGSNGYVAVDPISSIKFFNEIISGKSVVKKDENLGKKYE